MVLPYPETLELLSFMEDMVTKLGIDIIYKTGKTYSVCIFTMMLFSDIIYVLHIYQQINIKGLESLS